MRLSLGGVPLHPALVHFPVAFWAAAPVADLAGWLGADFDGWRLGHRLAIAGVVTSLPAICAGLLDALAARARRDAEPEVWKHAGLMFLTATLFLLALLPLSNPLRFALHALGAVSLLIGAHTGGRLAHVYRLPGEQPTR